MSEPRWHYRETFYPRHFDDTVEIWCPNVDETKVVLGERYTRYCPACGDNIQSGTAPRGEADE